MPALLVGSAPSTDAERTLLVLEAEELPAGLGLPTEAPVALRGLCTGTGGLLAWSLLCQRCRRRSLLPTSQRRLGFPLERRLWSTASSRTARHRGTVSAPVRPLRGR